MIILPAIDIIDGECVRLLKGEFDSLEKVFESPLKAATTFEKNGAKHLHVVDLDGAKKGEPVNTNIIKEILEKTSLKVEVGGGIRKMEHIETYINLGVSTVILGSIALKNPGLVKEAVLRYGNKIAVGIDAKDGYAKSEGWLEGSNVKYLDLAKAMEASGVKNIIYTDISKDGTLGGVNLEHMKLLQETVSISLTASGGVSSLKDIESLKKMNIYGVIIGKALYNGSFTLEEALSC